MNFELRTNVTATSQTTKLTISRALRIISERSTKGETRDLLLQDLTSRDKARRAKALNAMFFLVSNRARTAMFLTTFPRR